MFDIKPREWVFSNKDLLECVNKIRAKAKVNQEYDIPLLAGYSDDGKTLYVDKDMPDGYVSRYTGKQIPVLNFLLFHEGVEKALIDQWGLSYLPSHAVAQYVEHGAVKAADLPDKEYNGFMAKYIKISREKKEYHVPPDLDLTPYKGETEMLAKMKGLKNG